MKKLCIWVMIISSLLLVSCDNQDIYKNHAYHFQINKPKGYQLIKTGLEIATATYFLKKDFATISITPVAYVLREHKKNIDFVQENIKGFVGGVKENEGVDLQVLENLKTKYINGNQWYTITFGHSVRDIKYVLCYTFFKDYFYVATFYTRPEYEEKQFWDTLSTFKILNN